MSDAFVVVHSLESALGKCQFVADIPLLGPQAGEPDIGLQIFTRGGELVWYYCSPVCRSPIWQAWNLTLWGLCPSSCLVVASPLSSVLWWCKTQNSGLRSKEEKPRDQINQPSRYNTQEGLLSVAQTGDSDLLGGRAHRTANWASFYGQKNHIITILHTGYKVIGYMFAKQSYWYKLRWLHVYKAILLAQTSRAFVQT